MEEIRGTTWDLEGAQLQPWQGVQRLFWAGWSNVKVLAEAYATMMGESSDFLMAWHHNVERNEDGMIKRDDQGRITVKSTDLGYCQINTRHDSPILIHESEGDELAARLFTEHPDLADGKKSAVVARKMYVAAGNSFRPWFAHANFQAHIPTAILAVGNFLDVTMNHGKGNAIVHK